MKNLLYIVLSFMASGCHFQTQEPISFNRHIRPILNEKCLRCHGGVKTNGGFSLVFEEDAFSKTESGKPAIVRGDHRQSELYRRLVHTDPEARMPYEAEPLSPDEIDLIAQWIDQGAQWEKHWAYIPPIPDILPPAVKQVDWVKNPIDRFVAYQLEQVGLAPAKEAEKQDLLRRLCLDLTGLPPTHEEVRQFLQDDSPAAYEKLVDRLLASPRYGERWASMWLDLARYSDTKGYEKDSNRQIWKYRDWVIDAFNADMPYDQFTVEQLAGDLLPEPTESQLIATAFHRNTMANDEGGTDDEEFRVASVIERVGTTYEVWLGSTFACAQCHGHPYDPFRQEEFYRSMAFFNNAADRDIYSEYPKLYSYGPADAEKAQAIVQWITQRLKPEDKPVLPRYLYDQKSTLLEHLDYHVTEAEDYTQSSPLIELIWPELDMLWQIQDSSWIYFESVDLTKVQSIGFLAATPLPAAGSITIHLDSPVGKKIGEVHITKTGEWPGWQGSKPQEAHLLKEFKTGIAAATGRHDLYFRFWMGDTYIQHLFYLDKIIYYERSPRIDKYPAALREKVAELAGIPTTTTPIIQELSGAKARKTRLFERGSWLAPGQEVTAGIPGIFSDGVVDPPADRLAFSRWLVSEANPLTARVMVNRVWQQIFGQGLVETMEEFGSQGSAPSHPQLLDYLAMQFVEQHHWRIKPMLRQIMLSATYRQAAVADARKLEKDPLNQFLSRGPRTRLPAEQIRDQIFAVAGMLDTTIGGPSVILPELNIGEAFIPGWAAQNQTNKFRRSLYTFWKRTDPFAGMVTFDSPDRTVCSSRRIPTNTPLQALNLLNDTTYFLAAKALAVKMYEADPTLDAQLQHGYFLASSRYPGQEKLAALQTLYQKTLGHYKKMDTKKFGFEDYPLEKQRQLAALSIVANALFNMDEFVVKR